jgi:putative membrane protein
MKKSAPFLTLVLALVCLTLAGCQQQKGASSEGGYSEPRTTDQQASQQNQQQLSGDQQVIADAAIAGQAEMELSRTATTKTSNPAVKRLAQKLVEDHSKANQQLESLPQASQVLQSLNIPEDKRGKIEQISKLSGKEFDRAFIDHAVEAHEKSVVRFQGAASSAQGSEVKQFASQTLPVLQQHLEMAKSLQSQLAGSGGRKGQ